MAIFDAKQNTMKKVLKLSFAFAMAGLALVGCTKDDEEEEDLSPTMYVVTPTGGEANVEVGETVDFTITMATNDKLEVLSGAISVDGSAPAVLDLNGEEEGTDLEIDNASNKSFTYNGSYTTVAEASYVLSFTVRDNKDRTSSVSITINATNAVTIASYTQVLLGNQNATEGSFYNAIENLVYNVAQGGTNSEKVDFLYFDGSANSHTLSSPSASESAQVYGAVSGWGNRNATTFSSSTVGSSNDFDAVASASGIEALSASTSASLANQLSVGDVYGFTLDSNRGSKSGLVRVDAISTDNTMTISVKIEL